MHMIGERVSVFEVFFLISYAIVIVVYWFWTRELEKKLTRLKKKLKSKKKKFAFSKKSGYD